jgi:hypothetical protein
MRHFILWFNNNVLFRNILIDGDVHRQSERARKSGDCDYGLARDRTEPAPDLSARGDLAIAGLEGDGWEFHSAGGLRTIMREGS